MLSKETKVSVKNKENKTACFIEIEGLLNSLELISDMPRLGLKSSKLTAERRWCGDKSPMEAGRSHLHLSLAAETVAMEWSSEGRWQ
jgi:hypothetical protein